MDRDRSRASSSAHRLGLPKLYILTLDVRFRAPAHRFKTGSGNAILGAWERTAQTLTALVGVGIG
jgi:hypothetical protein